jgi:hypothetical protein
VTDFAEINIRLPYQLTHWNLINPKEKCFGCKINRVNSRKKCIPIFFLKYIEELVDEYRIKSEYNGVRESGSWKAKTEKIKI